MDLKYNTGVHWNQGAPPYPQQIQVTEEKYSLVYIVRVSLLAFPRDDDPGRKSATMDVAMKTRAMGVQHNL